MLPGGVPLPFSRSGGGRCVIVLRLAGLTGLACGGAGITPVIGEETELEVSRRISDAGAIYFVMNFKDQELPLPAAFAGKKDLLSGREMKEGEVLKKYDVRIAVL